MTPAQVAGGGGVWSRPRAAGLVVEGRLVEHAHDVGGRIRHDGVVGGVRAHSRGDRGAVLPRPRQGPERHHRTQGRDAARAAKAVLAGAASTTIVVKDFRDGFLPYTGGEVKEYFEELKTTVSPDLVLTHYERDAHEAFSRWPTISGGMQSPVWCTSIAATRSTQYGSDLSTARSHAGEASSNRRCRTEAVVRPRPTAAQLRP